MESKIKTKKIINVASNVLLYLFIAICIIGVILTITAKKDSDGTATILGRQMRLVISPSMEKCDQTDVSKFEIKDIPVNSMIFIEVVPRDAEKAEAWYEDLEIGDVLTFKYVYTRQETITHRITDITEKDTGGYIIKLEGDNKSADSGVLTQVIDTSAVDSTNYVIGKVTGKSLIIGLFITALKSPLGLIFIVIVPAMAIMAYEIIKIVKLVNEDKKKQEQEEKEKQQREMDELRRKLEELEALKTNLGASDGESES